MPLTAPPRKSRATIAMTRDQGEDEGVLGETLAVFVLGHPLG
jgi:hypothetical protein